MLSGPVAESELRFNSKLNTLSEESRNSWVQLGLVDTESDEFKTRFRSKHEV